MSDTLSIRVPDIEFVDTPALDQTPDRLHGTVFTAEGQFTGFVQWNREDCLATDTLVGYSNDAKTSLPFDSINTIERHSRDSSRVTRTDGSRLVLSGTREAGQDNRGIYVDDARFGRVLVSWDAFQRIDFSNTADSGPAYDDFPDARDISGSVTLNDGSQLRGRLVYDLDEHLSVETLDAPSRGVHYTIPFGMIESIRTSGVDAGEDYVRVVLHNGETLDLERRDDLGSGNAGLLVFAPGSETPQYIAWRNIEQISFDPPGSMFPPIVNR